MNPNEEKEVEKEVEKKIEAPRMRQIILETDGNNVNIVKAEVSGKIELVAIMNLVASNISVSK
jgi:hypothetical protein